MELSYGPGGDGFGVVSVLVLAALAAVLAAAFWAARRPDLGAALAHRVRDSAAGRWAEDRLGDRARALAARLSVSVVAGLALLAGFVAVAAAGAAFAKVTEDVLEGDGLNAVDQPATDYLTAHRERWLTTVLETVTHLGDWAVLGALTVTVCALAVWRRRTWLPAALGVIGAAGIGLVIMAAKSVVARSRPGSPFALIAEDGYSFPSGHATGTAAVTVLCAWIVTRWLVTGWPGRVAVWATAVAVTGTVGFSRVYLGVHYFTDVVAGWLLGLCWAATVVIVGSWWENARRVRSASRASRSR